MNKKLYLTKRKGALGALMDLYEQEVELLLETINTKVTDENWAEIKDPETKDEDCKSIQTICRHMVGAADYYVDLVKKTEDPAYKIARTVAQLPTKSDFAPQLQAALNRQIELLNNRWEMTDEAIDAMKIKTGWGPILDPETLMEHAVMHIMRHHRQILCFVDSAIIQGREE